jgi:hypothetical protein
MLRYRNVLLTLTEVVPTMTVRTYPNQKPLVTVNIHIELKDRAAAFKERETNLDTYKKYCYALRRTIKEAKRQYRIKIESYYTGSDARQLWQGLKPTMDYKRKPRHSKHCRPSVLAKPA